MPSTSILPAAAGSTGSVAQAVAKRTKLSQDEFFKVLTAQLTQQDPLKPMDSQDFLGQLVQLQNLQVTSDLSNNFSSMLSQNALASAGALLGKLVTGTDASGAPLAGMVSGISVDSGKILLNIGAGQMSMQNVTEIVDPSSLIPH